MHRTSMGDTTWGTHAGDGTSRRFDKPSSLVSQQLFGVTARDPSIFVFVGVLLAAAAVVASAVPTLRAMRADPLEALRSE